LSSKKRKNMSKIQWTDVTWNPITGCTPLSDGCTNCYARLMANRLHKMGLHKYRNGFKPTFHPKVLYDPYKWKKSKKIFVCSMGDIFHYLFSDDAITRIFLTIENCPQHTFQVLTKRPERLRDFKPVLDFENLWFGTTVESERYLGRVNYLPVFNKKCKSFISFEPLLSEIPEIDLTGIDWVIVGGETGPGARPMKIEWARKIRDMCIEQGVPFFFKSHGGKRKKPGHDLLDGKRWNEFPE
jgi:protein gp37